MQASMCACTESACLKKIRHSNCNDARKMRSTMSTHSPLSTLVTSARSAPRSLPLQYEQHRSANGDRERRMVSFDATGKIPKPNSSSSDTTTASAISQSPCELVDQMCAPPNYRTPTVVLAHRDAEALRRHVRSHNRQGFPSLK